MNTLDTQPASVSLDELLGQYWDCAHREGTEGRTHDTENGDAQRTLSALQTLFEEQAAVIQRLTEEANARQAPPMASAPFRVYVSTMAESHRITYLPTLVNLRHDPATSGFDTTNVLTPDCFEERWKAEQEAQDWAEFLGVVAEPYAAPAWLESKLAEIEARKS